MTEEKKPSLLGCAGQLCNTVITTIVWVYLCWALIIVVTINGVPYHVGSCSVEKGVPLYRSTP